MSIKLNSNATVPVRLMVETGSGPAAPVTSTTAQNIKIKDVLIAAFEAIPSQAGGTATVAAIVTALKTLP